MHQEYKNDKLIYNSGIRAGMGYNLICACEKVKEMTKYVKFPFLLAVGEKDLVCSTKDMEEFYELSTSEDKQKIIYPELYHELLFEPEADQVISDMIDYFEKSLKSGKII